MVKKAFSWKNRRVLVTGYEGFLGSWLTRFLLEAGARITGLDIRTGRRDTILTRQERSAMRVVRQDVAEYRPLAGLLRRDRPAFVFHLAAEALVGRCLDDPRRGFLSNIAGTWNVLEACRQVPATQAIVAASSDKAYGSHEQLPYREDFPLQGNHPYDVSKSCADLLCAAYWHTYGTPVCVTRCGNLYGPGDYNFSRIVPEAMRCAIAGRTLVLRSDGSYVRDYVYVKDIAAAYILLAERMAESGTRPAGRGRRGPPRAPRVRICGQAFNFSDEQPLSVRQVVDAVYRAAGSRPRLRILDRARFEIRDQYLDSRKSRQLLGWKPRYTLERAMEETLRWYAALIKR